METPKFNRLAGETGTLVQNVHKRVLCHGSRHIRRSSLSEWTGFKQTFKQIWHEPYASQGLWHTYFCVLPE